jgi:hypothetical protein
MTVNGNIFVLLSYQRLKGMGGGYSEGAASNLRTEKAISTILGS